MSGLARPYFYTVHLQNILFWAERRESKVSMDEGCARVHVLCPSGSTCRADPEPCFFTAHGGDEMQGSGCGPSTWETPAGGI